VRILLLASLVLFAAAPAAAQSIAPRPTLSPRALPAERLPPVVVRAPPTFASAGIGVGGLVSQLRPLGAAGGSYGLQSVGDPRPQCRSKCAQARLYCDGDEGQCGNQERQCRVKCADLR
jgi:hypothetical protein